jgi:NAD+ kinase
MGVNQPAGTGDGRTVVHPAGAGRRWFARSEHGSVHPAMTNGFQRIGLIGKFGDPGVGDTLSRLVDFLLARGRSVSVEASCADCLPATEVPLVDRATLAGSVDLAIVVGGDGTMLNAGRSLADAGVPLMGINLGRLGFLADVSPDEMFDQLDRVLNHEYETDTRTLVHAAVHRDGRVVSDSDALNDVVVHKWDIARMIELEVRIGGHLLHTSRSDGLIVSTPTGSTAYALSGGGPILHPGLAALVLVPICPHTLSNRPIVVDDSVEVEILVHDSGPTQAQVTCDGQVNFALQAGDQDHRRRPRHDCQWLEQTAALVQHRRSADHQLLQIRKRTLRRRGDAVL